MEYKYILVDKGLNTVRLKEEFVLTMHMQNGRKKKSCFRISQLDSAQLSVLRAIIAM